MAGLTEQYFEFIVNREASGDVDYFNDTKGFLQSVADQYAPGKKVSDELASSFLAQNLPEQQASGPRVLGNFMGRLYSTAVEGTIKAGAEALDIGGEMWEQGQQAGEMERAAMPVTGLTGYIFKKGKNLVDKMLLGEDASTEKPLSEMTHPGEIMVRQMREGAQRAVQNAHAMVEPLTPDWAKERATSFTGSLAEQFGEAIVRDLPALVALHTPSAAVGEMVEAGAARLAPKLFGKTMQKVTTTFADDGVSMAVEAIAGQKGVRTLTQKILSSFAYDAGYGLPQGVGITMGTPEVYGALRNLDKTTDKGEIEKNLSIISTRVAEDQFMNLLIGMGAAPILGGLSRLLPDHAARRAAVERVFQTIGPDGQAPLPVSQGVGEMMQKLAVTTDAVQRQKLIHNIEFTSAQEGIAHIDNWLLEVREILKDEMNLNRGTGKILTSWRDQLDARLQGLNQLLEQSGVMPTEAHLGIMENMMKTIARLEDIYETSGAKRLDTLMDTPDLDLSYKDLLIKKMFQSVDKADVKDMTSALIDLPPAVDWFRSLSTGNVLQLAKVGIKDAPLKMSEAAEKDLMSLFSDPADMADPDAMFKALRTALFDPSIVMNRAAFIDSAGQMSQHIQTVLHKMERTDADPEKIKRSLENALDNAHKKGQLDTVLLYQLATDFSKYYNTDTLDSKIFGVPFKQDQKRSVYQAMHNFYQYPTEVMQTALKTFKEQVKSFFGGVQSDEILAIADIAESFYSRFRAELSNAQPLLSFHDTGAGTRGYAVRSHDFMAMGPSAHWTTFIHEITHLFENLLPPDVISSFHSYWSHTTSMNDFSFVGGRVDGNSVIPLDSHMATDTNYWGSFEESFARYMQNLLGGSLANSAHNVLQVPPEVLNIMRASARGFADVAEKIYDGKEHAILAREVMGLIVDDLDRYSLLTNKKFNKMWADLKQTTETRIPTFLKEHNIQVEKVLDKEMARELGGPVENLRALLSEVDKTLNITHENRTMEQLVNRFFRLKDLFQQHIVRNPETRSFYEGTVFTGNKKVLENLEKGFGDTNLITAVIDATDDPRALHNTYEGFKNFVMQADELISGAYQHSPQVWITHDTAAFTSSLDKIYKNVLRRIPWYRDREGLTQGISRISRLTDQAEFLIKKMPLLKPIYGAWERHMQDSRKFLNEIFEGTHQGMDMRDARPVQEYFALVKGDPKLAMVDDLLRQSNEISNQLAAKVPPEDLPPLDDYGRLGYDYIRATMPDVPEPLLREVYELYSGVRSTLGFVLQDMRKLAKHKMLLSDNELVNMTQRFGQLRGYIPQTRKGKYMLSATEEVLDEATGQLKEQPVLIFSDDISKLREMQRMDYPNAQVGIVQKKFDYSHFSTNAAAIDKILSTVAEGKGLDEDILKALRQETSNLLKSGSFLSSTIKRKNVAGWDQTRVREGIYEYLQGYSRFRHKHDAMQESLVGISYLSDRRYAEGWKWAQNLIHDMNTYTDSYKVLETARSLVIFKMLGANVSSALMQITQNPIMALPRMILDGIPRSGRQLLVAFKDVIQNTNLGEYEQRALREGHLIGVTYANNINALMGNVKQGTATSAMAQRVLEGSMFMMRKMEELNRQSTLLASYRGIREQLLKALPPGAPRDLEGIHQQALERAVTITKDAHLTYNKLNRPEIIRGGALTQQLGRQFYLLKQFSHGYAQLFGYMMRNGTEGQKAAAKSALALAALGGFSALPGYEQLSESMKKLTDKDANEHLEELMGFGGRVLGHGMSAFLPGPLGQRLNPMPRDLTSLIAPPGYSLVEGMQEAQKAWKNGDYVRMFWQMPFVPISVGNIPKELERGLVGHTTKSGKPIRGTKHSIPEMLSGFIGLTPRNEEFVKYTRARYKEQVATEKRSELFSQIRREGQRGKLSQETIRAFYDEQRRMLRNGQRMSYKTPHEVLRQEAE